MVKISVLKPFPELSVSFLLVNSDLPHNSLEVRNVSEAVANIPLSSVSWKGRA